MWDESVHSIAMKKQHLSTLKVYFKLEEETSAYGSQKFHLTIGLEVDSFSLYDLETLHDKSL